MPPSRSARAPLPRLLPMVFAVFLLAFMFGHAARANPFATLYDDGRYAGSSRLVTGDIPSLGALDFGDKTSSIRILTTQPIAVYKDANFAGACKTIWSDVPSLAGIGFGNDNLSSVRVHYTCEGGPIELDACARNPCPAGQFCVDLSRPAPDSAEGRQCASIPQAPANAIPIATLFADGSYAGTNLVIKSDQPSLGALGFGDTASSVRLHVSTPIAVYQDAAYQGACRTLTGNVPSLAGIGFGNDNLSSIRVHFTCEDGPVEVDACQANPCSSGHCVDLPRPAPATADGRVCVSWAPPERPARGATNLALGVTQRNLAVGRPTRASSTLGPNTSAFAVDNNRNGGLANASVFHSQTEPSPWFEIDLGAPEAIDTVQLFNRTDCCGERLAGTRIELSSTPCHTPTPIAISPNVTGNVPTFRHTFPGAPEARYVCVRDQTNDPLQLAEVEVLAPPTGLPNLARGKAAFGNPVYDSAAWNRLTDGVTTGTYVSATVVHTQPTVGNYVQVDLGQPTTVATLVAHNRSDCCRDRLASATLEVTNKPCADSTRTIAASGAFAWSEFSTVEVLSLPVPAVGRYLCLRQASAIPLNLAELEAYGPETDTLKLPAYARQSSQWGDAVAERAIDGITAGAFNLRSVQHTAAAPNAGLPGDAAPWLEVDLRQSRNIGRVLIHNRSEAMNRLTGARLELSLDPCNNPARRVVRDEQLTVFNRHQRIPSAVGGAGYNATEQAVIEGRVKRHLGGVSPLVQAVDFIDAPSARFVCLRHDVPEFLHVAELEVFPAVPAENLARRPEAVARQVSTDAGQEALRAIDGRPWGDTSLSSVAQTTAVANAWWEVDLGSSQAVRAVAVFNRTDAEQARLRDVVVELSEGPCDEAGRTIVAQHTVRNAPIDNAWIRREPLNQAQSLTRDLPARRTEFDFGGQPGRYVCVRRVSGSEPLALAEVEVFGTSFAVPPPPLPLPTTSTVLATTPAPAAVSPTPVTVSTAGTTTTLTVGTGALTASCQVTTVASGRFSLSCAGGPAIAMRGSLSGTNYDLESEASLSFADLVAGAWFPASVRDLFGRVADVFGASGLRLGLATGKGFHLRGTIDLTQVPGAGVLSTGLEKLAGSLSAILPSGAITMTPTFELIPSLTTSSLGLSLRVNVIETCAGPSEVPVIGTGLKLERGAVVFTIGLGPTGLTATAGLAAKLYLKPTRHDPWLMVTPGFDLGAAGTGGTLTVRGSVSGACGECAATCSCTEACTAPWNPLGLSALALRDGFVEVGVTTVAGAVPTPSITAGFQDARLGDVRGSFAIAFDTRTQAYGFRFGAKRLPLAAALEVFGGIPGVTDKIPRELALKDPLVSFGSRAMNLYGVDVPKGLRLRGGVDFGSLGFEAAIDATVDSGTIDLSRVAQGNLVSGLPGGSLSLRFKVPDVAGLVVKAIGLGSFARTIVQSTFSVTRLELNIGLSANSVSLGGGIDFRLLGESHSFGLQVGASWNLDALIRQLANKVADLVGGAMIQAFNAVKDAAETAYRETSAALAKGGAVVINGIVTVGSVAISASADALGNIAGFATRAWNSARSFFGF